MPFREAVEFLRNYNGCERDAPAQKPGVVKKSLATNCQESFELETFHRVRVFASERR